MTTYTDYPFNAQGINFISRVHTDSPFARQIADLPAGVFETMNIQAVSDLMNLSTFTLDEIKSELDRVNEGGTHAFILLGENN
jgi:hypothetical protein